MRSPIRITRGVVFVSTLALISGPALTLLGVARPSALGADRFLEWLLVSGPRILVVVIVTYVVVRAILLATGRFESRLGEDTDASDIERAKRARTVAPASSALRSDSARRPWSGT